MTLCTCPRFMGYLLHRHPCSQAGEVTDLLAEAPDPQEGSDG